MDEITKNLIYGKNDTERIVSIEVEDDSAILFREDENGITQEVVPNRFWLLSNTKINNKFVRMEGEQHYKWGIQFTEREEFYKMRRVWSKYDTYSIYNAQEALMVKDGYTYFKGMKSNHEVSTLAFDIETTGLNHDKSSLVILIANTFRKNGKITRKMFCYDEYKSQAELFNAWCAWVREVDPSIITGHNIAIYDLPYLQYCAKEAGTELNLGRDGSVITFAKYTSAFRKDGSQTLDYNKARIYGREIIDTMFLSVKYDVGRNFPNYRLKDIIKYLGMDIEGRVYYDASTIRDNYKIPEEMVKIKKYAEHDGDEALMLLDKMLPSQFIWSQSIPKTFQAVSESATGSQINSIMVRSYLQERHSIAKASESVGYEGAISNAVPGIYSNCIRWDVASLYPSIMRQYRVYNKDKDPKKHFLTMVEYFTLERLKNKQLAKETNDEYYNALQESQKIGVNSAYGFLGAPGLNYNSPDDAAFVTKQGREILTSAIMWASGKTPVEVFGDKPTDDGEA